ncbi:MAG: hypothetical protein N4A71_11020 [Carboxylicivirga sp.]|jgi:hypothetical protein|nr:hypothetical protein [Carboxylicivirga sp.]
MKSLVKTFLAHQKELGALNSDFYNQVISEGRTKGILKGTHGASSREINRIAKYFNVPHSALIERKPPKLIDTICEHCGEAFIPGNKKAKYCSDRCRNRAFRANN